MTRRRTQAMEVVRRVEAHLRKWDPIGVMVGEGSPVDEYDSYAPRIVSLLTAGTSESELAAHLEYVRTVTMGLPTDPSRDLKCAQEILASWPEAHDEQR
ncbi:MAG: hypothetical protein OES25_13940 [Acidobacteriota bacterium]|nr:hypothetical protein [Acidobacteriota bacterium]